MWLIIAIGMCRVIGLYSEKANMRTVQITIDSDLLDDVDAAVQEIGSNRSAFIRAALKLALRRHDIEKQEARHAAGYAAHPVQPDEFDGWETEQVWGAWPK